MRGKHSPFQTCNSKSYVWKKDDKKQAQEARSEHCFAATSKSCATPACFGQDGRCGQEHVVPHSPNEHNERVRIVCSATAAEFHVEFVGSDPELGRLQAAAVQREPHKLLAPKLEGEGDKVPVAPLAWTAREQVRSNVKTQAAEVARDSVGGYYGGSKS